MQSARFPRQHAKKYEEQAYILDFQIKARSRTVKGREGIIIQSLGDEYFTLLELLGLDNVVYTIGEKLYIGKNFRDKVLSVLGRLAYTDLTPAAKGELPNVIERIVTEKEKKFVEYFNRLQPITPRMHALELIPGIGKAVLKKILEERERRRFESFKDIEERVGLKNPEKQVAKRVLEELKGETQTYIFVKRQ